jgi:hypothetical protein
MKAFIGQSFGLSVATSAARGILAKPATIPKIFPPAGIPDIGNPTFERLPQIPARMQCSIRVRIR